MRITVFTSNQPRHVALIESLASIADEVFAVLECNTAFPGQVDDFFRKSDVMRDYFSRVIAAERQVFGGPRFLPPKARSISLKMGDLGRAPIDAIEPIVRASDHVVVFGASYIKGPLCDALVARRAINIHMGVSPHYRGSSTNFWAMYDRRPDLVGATIHLLSAGLDSGPILCHAFPKADDATEPFEYGMRAVAAAHRALIGLLRDGSVATLAPVSQDRSKELRYTRNADFTDAVASEYLQRLPSGNELRAALMRRELDDFIRPVLR